MGPEDAPPRWVKVVILVGSLVPMTIGITLLYRVERGPTEQLGLFFSVLGAAVALVSLQYWMTWR